MERETTLKDLMHEAAHMLADRQPQERKLIYQIAKMESGERAAIILAYEHVLPEWGFND